MEKVEIDIDGKLISIEAGDLARQAGGAVIVRQGDTMLLVTATMAGQAREGIDFFPLTVDYREKNLCRRKNSRQLFQAGSPPRRHRNPDLPIDRQTYPTVVPESFQKRNPGCCAGHLA